MIKKNVTYRKQRIPCKHDLERPFVTGKNVLPETIPEQILANTSVHYTSATNMAQALDFDDDLGYSDASGDSDLNEFEDMYEAMILEYDANATEDLFAPRTIPAPPELININPFSLSNVIQSIHLLTFSILDGGVCAPVRLMQHALEYLLSKLSNQKIQLSACHKTCDSHNQERAFLEQYVLQQKDSIIIYEYLLKRRRLGSETTLKIIDAQVHRRRQLLDQAKTYFSMLNEEKTQDHEEGDEAAEKNEAGDEDEDNSSSWETTVDALRRQWSMHSTEWLNYARTIGSTSGKWPLIYYHNAVVGVRAQSKVEDYTLQSNDRLFYHFKCHDGHASLWNKIFSDVTYTFHPGVLQVEQRWQYTSGFPDFRKDTQLRDQVSELVNFYMMRSPTSSANGFLDDAALATFKDVATESIATHEESSPTHRSNYVSTFRGTPSTASKIAFPVIDEAGADNMFLTNASTWSSMLLDIGGRLTTNQLDLIVRHLGSQGTLRPTTSGASLISTNMREIEHTTYICITYEVTIIPVDFNNLTIPDVSVARHELYTENSSFVPQGQPGQKIEMGEEAILFQSKTFAYTNGHDKDAALISPGKIDLSRQPASGVSGTMRFRKYYGVCGSF